MRDYIIAADVVVYVLVASGSVDIHRRRSFERVREYLSAVHFFSQSHCEDVGYSASPALSGEPVRRVPVPGKRSYVVYDLVHGLRVSIVLSRSLPVRSVYCEVLLPDLVAKLPVDVHALHDHCHERRVAEALFGPGVIAVVGIGAGKVAVADLLKADALQEGRARIVVLIAHTCRDQLHGRQSQFLVLR